MLFSMLRVSLKAFCTHDRIAFTVIFNAAMSYEISRMFVAKYTKRRGRVHHAVVIVDIKLLLGL